MVYVHEVVFKSSQGMVDYSPNIGAINEYTNISNRQITILGHRLLLGLLLHFSESLPSIFYCYEQQSVDKTSSKVPTQIPHDQ